MNNFQLNIMLGLIIFLFGFLFGLILFPSNLDNLTFFGGGQDEPSVIRLNCKQRVDSIFVDNGDSKTFIRLEEYLKTIPLKSERKISEFEIKKRVDWFNENKK
jgi:hypothetical protein